MTLCGKFFAGIAVLAVCFAFAGCSGADGQNDGMFAYRQFDASFTVVFPSVSGDVRCSASKIGDRITFTVEEPERSAGITVTSDAGGCSITAGEVTIPLSDEAAFAIVDAVEILYGTPDDTSGLSPADAARSNDGSVTRVTTDAGVLSLDENLLPCEIECRSRNGSARIIRIENYKVITSSEK